MLLLGGATAAPAAPASPDAPPDAAQRGTAVARAAQAGDAPDASTAIADARAVLHGALPGAADTARATLGTLAAAGNAAAAVALAEADYLGLGTPRDLAAAIAWWSRAAALGDATAAYNAGLLLLRSAEGDERARALLAQAAAHGDARAAFALGTELATHDDRHAAIPLLEQAAKSGYAPAQYNLARLHEAHDRAAAVHWYRRAAPDFAPAAEALARLEADTSGPTSGPGGAETPTDGRAWLLAQPPSAYTIQVGAGPDPQALARLLDAHAGTLPSAWFAHRREGGDPYVAVVGSFADPAAAEAALATLPEALTRHRPWVRRIGGLQSTLDAAAPP